jgi:hypothetical protein
VPRRVSLSFACRQAAHSPGSAPSPGQACSDGRSGTRKGYLSEPIPAIPSPSRRYAQSRDAILYKCRITASPRPRYVRLTSRPGSRLARYRPTPPRPARQDPPRATAWPPAHPSRLNAGPSSPSLMPTSLTAWCHDRSSHDARDVVDHVDAVDPAPAVREVHLEALGRSRKVESSCSPHNCCSPASSPQRVEPGDQGRVQGPVRQGVWGEWFVGIFNRSAFGLGVCAGVDLKPSSRRCGN